MKKFIQLSLVAASLATIGCGANEKPLEDYQKIPKEAPMDRPKSDISGPVQLYYIDVESTDQLNFFQGKSGEVKFNVRLNFSNNSKVRYKIKVVESPTKAQELVRVGQSDTWSYTWAPAANTLTASENTKAYKLVLKFELDSSSSPESIAELKPYSKTREFLLILNKDKSVPSVRLNSDKEITVNPDDKVKISFSALAKSGLSADDIQVSDIAGPAAPTNELAQMNARIGFISPVKHVGSKKLDNGQTAHNYEVVFSARPFVDAMLNAIEANNSILEAKYKEGRVKSAEAVFYVEAVNLYNGMRSPQIQVTINVNLTDKAVEASIIGSESIVAKAGNQTSPQVFIAANDKRTQVQVKSISIGQNTAELKKGVGSIVDGDIKINVDCSASATAGQKAQFSCASGQCFEFCKIDIETPCGAAQRTTVLGLNTESKMGEDIKNKTLNYNIKIHGQNAICAGVKP